MNLFIDANVFLSFFHLSNDDLEEIHKLAVLITKGDVVLWLPQQIKDEFNRNRENKLLDSIKKLNEQKTKPQFPQICKDYDEYSEIRELQKNYNKKLSSLINNINSDVSERTLKADQKISELFGISNLIVTTQELIDKARARMDVRNPPGKDGSLGDAINWEALLESTPDGEDLYFIADDKDYYSVLDKSKLKDFLQDEWGSKKTSGVIIYRRLSQFFEEHYPEIKLASELEKELTINSLASSCAFATTHAAISKLVKYAEFNQSQVNELVQAATSNNQVRWIICDPDVNEFYINLYNNHSDSIEPELKEKLLAEFKDCGPEENDA